MHSKTGAGTAELIPVWMPVWTICFISFSVMTCALLALHRWAVLKTPDDWSFQGLQSSGIIVEIMKNQEPEGWSDMVGKMATHFKTNDYDMDSHFKTKDYDMD